MDSMDKHTNEYWVRKFKLWFILHGGMDRYKQKERCRSCEHYPNIRSFVCPLRIRGKSRLMVNCYFRLAYGKRRFDRLWHCAEWVKNV